MQNYSLIIQNKSSTIKKQIFLFGLCISQTLFCREIVTKVLIEQNITNPGFTIRPHPPRKAIRRPLYGQTQ